MSFSNLPVSRKLAAAFLAVLLAIAAMGATIYLNLQSVTRAGNARSVASAAESTAGVIEFKLARQENSLRGFLLSTDPYYIERLDKHRADFKAALAEVRQGASPEVVTLADNVETAADAWHTNVVEVARRLASNPATRAQAVAMVSPDGVADGYIEPVEAAMDALKSEAVARLDAARAEQSRATATAMLALMIGLGAAVVIAIIAGWILTGAIVKPIQNMIGHMRQLMSGNTGIDVPCAMRKDEFGQMGVAILAFRDAAIDKTRLEAQAQADRATAEAERAANLSITQAAAEEQAAVVTALAEGLDHLTRGDLTYELTQAFPGDYAKLKSDFNEAIRQLHDAMTAVVTNVSAIRSGSGEISHAADDLSRRTEQQAASLEETAAALDQITATVTRTASGAEQASRTVQAAKTDAETSGRIVQQAVTAMGAIEKSSTEISQIIGVIDEIAFQTNLLALNAGVEAARAGDAGRGFAVVAQEVRALAQRSAEAAKEIKVLISASSGQVNNGVSLVDQTGDALQRIVGRVAEIDGLVSEIAASAHEQATGLGQINSAVNQMDQVTQQNAAMVEQSTAASHALSQEAEILAGSVSRFRIAGPARGTARAPAASTGPAARAPATRPQTVTAMRTIGRGGAALKSQAVASTDIWEEF